ncbi:MAG: aspartyl beta-hydroxylase, partial [Gammaproteobacteria bacterium]|nr:aspartyl beta-hydroxylase [Gammaproteobacteria bacterium]
MTNTSASSDDRIRLPLNFDATRIPTDIEGLKLSSFIYYDVIPLRAPAYLVDPSRPAPPPVDDYADGSWTEWLDTPVIQNSEYLTSVIDTFRAHTDVTLVRLLRLEADEIVKEHTDPTLGLHVEKSVIRLTIPILTNDGVEF